MAMLNSETAPKEKQITIKLFPFWPLIKKKKR